MQITDSGFTRPKDEHSSYFGRPYDVLVVSDDQTTANMDPCYNLCNYITCFKSGYLYLGRVAPSAIGWYKKGSCIKLRLHDKIIIQKLSD